MSKMAHSVPREIQGRRNRGGQGGRGHPNILRKFEILGVNLWKLFIWGLRPPQSFELGHPKNLDLAPALITSTKYIPFYVCESALT